MKDEGGFARAVGAQQRHCFTGVELEIHTGERNRPVLISEMKIAYQDYRSRTHDQMRTERKAAIGRLQATQRKAASSRRKRVVDSSWKCPWNPRETMAR